MSAAEVAYRVGKITQSKLQGAGFGLARLPPPSPHRGKSWIEPLPKSFPLEPYKEAADRILAGRFNLFSFQDPEPRFPPFWNRDASSGTFAPLTFGKKIDYRDPRVVGDIKYLWEPNRHLELVTLAQAWHLTGDVRYAEGCRTLLSSWLDQCPYPLGVNWTSSLELAIRLINWSFAWHLLGGDRAPIFATEEGQAFKRRWLDSVGCHCHFIAGYQSLHSSANNHLLGELLGLFIAALTWPAWSQSAEWLEYAHGQIEREALIQNFSDGVNKEQGIWYHHEVADMMLIAGLVGRANGRDFSRDYWDRWEAMLDFVASVMDVSGHVPAIGDADDAVMVRLSQEAEISPFRSLLASGAVLLDREDFKAKARRFDDKSRWLCGDAGADRFAALSAPREPHALRRSFPEGGYYILGSDFDTQDEVKVVADAGPLGFLAIAAHGHADALSLVLSVGGREILTDSGTYSYHTEREWRDFFRGTFAHNTVRVDERDQSTSGGTFLWTRHAQAKCEEFTCGNGLQLWRAHHDGYLVLPDPVKHTRELLYHESQRTLQVTDSLTARESHTIELLWHFSESCVVTQRGDSVVAQDSRVVVTMTPPRDLAIELVKGATAPRQGWISRQFGARSERVTVVCRGAIHGNWQGATQLQIALI